MNGRHAHRIRTDWPSAIVFVAAILRAIQAGIHEWRCRHWSDRLHYLGWISARIFVTGVCLLLLIIANVEGSK